MAAIIRETLLKINERNEIELGSTANGNALKKQKRDERKERIPYAQGHGIISRGYILHERAGGISRTSNTWPFVEKKKRRKKGRWEKWRRRCKYIRFTAKSTGRKCAEGQSPSATGDHTYARRRNSRWRWITWPGFKARSPPSRVALTRRASFPLPPLSIPSTHSYPWSMRRTRVLPKVSAIWQSIEHGSVRAISCRTRFFHS